MNFFFLSGLVAKYTYLCRKVDNLDLNPQHVNNRHDNGAGVETGYLPCPQPHSRIFIHYISHTQWI